MCLRETEMIYVTDPKVACKEALRRIRSLYSKLAGFRRLLFKRTILLQHLDLQGSVFITLTPGRRRRKNLDRGNGKEN